MPPASPGWTENRCDPGPHRQLSASRSHGRPFLPAQPPAGRHQRAEAASQMCAAAGCDNPVLRRPGVGRPPIYCSLACRPSRSGAAGQLSVEIHQDDDQGDSTGRSWTVALRRGTRSVIVGRDLGRFSASVLSEELRALLHPRTRREGDTIE